MLPLRVRFGASPIKNLDDQRAVLDVGDRGSTWRKHSNERREDGLRRLKRCDCHAASRLAEVRSPYTFVTESGVRCFGAKFDPYVIGAAPILAPAMKQAASIFFL